MDFYGVLLTADGTERYVTAKYTTKNRMLKFGVAPFLKDPSVEYLVVYRLSYSKTDPWHTYKFVKSAREWYLKPAKYSKIPKGEQSE